MENERVIIELIRKRDTKRLLDIVLETDIVADSQVLTSYLWDSFLPNQPPNCKDQEVSNITCDQIERDVERSFIQYPDINQQKINFYQEGLRRVLLEIFESPFFLDHQGVKHELHYYQGFHDIASILVLKFPDPQKRLNILGRISRSHLRDFMDPDCLHTRNFSTFIFELILLMDPELGKRLDQINMSPFVFVSWFLAWFSHEVDSVSHISRVFDALVMMPPSAVGYVSALMVCRSRGLVMNEEVEIGSESFGLLHQALKSLPREHWSPDLIKDAYRLMTKYPPSKIIKSRVPALRHSSFDQDLPVESYNAAVIFGGVSLLVIMLAFLLGRIYTHPVSTNYDLD